MKERQYSKSYRALANGSYVREVKKVIRPLSVKNAETPCARFSQLFLVQQPPTPLLPLIGRERELGAICDLLQQPEVRLLTLAGPGGVGKTRLACQIANKVLSTFADGICFVSLASICASDFVLPTIARALGLNERSDDFLLAQVQAVIRDKNFLLLLDNFEHVVRAAPQLKSLLAACPRLKLLITSRTILRLLEERVCYITPLALPDLANLPSCEELSQVAAVSLFLQRIRTTHPNFELTDSNAYAIAQICIRLDGLPLSLELAAARIKLFSPQNLLVRLGHRLSFLTSGTCDAPERQQTLRKSIEWSYHLLTQEEQRLFRRLSVFSGGCSLQAIEAISDATGMQEEVLLNALTSLLDQSLLQTEPLVGNEKQRFTMLETIREYALECLQASNEEETIRQVHFEYYLAQAKAIGEETASLMEWIESEFENLRAALSWFLLSRDTEQNLKADILVFIAMCLVGMGVRVALQKQYAWAACLWGKAKFLSKGRDDLSELGSDEWVTTTLGASLHSSQAMETVHARIGERTFSDLWTKGQSMTLEHVLAGPGSQMIATKSSLPAKASVIYSDRLTSRERDVLCLLSQGLSSALIAEQLVISLTTVNSHIRTIYNKIGVSCRSAATRYAIEHHLV